MNGNDYENYDFLIPRDEKMLCQFFEDLFFMRTEKWEGSESKKEKNDFSLNNEDLELLAQTGVINRIFRRWFQTTWGDRTWSRHFDGETPRQELSHYYPDLEHGPAILSTELKKLENDWKIVPHLFLSDKISKEGGVFSFGKKEIENSKVGLTVPALDIGFRDFFQNMLTVEKIAQTLGSYNPSTEEEQKYWLLFWEQVGMSLISRIGLDLSVPDMIRASKDVLNILDEAVSSQGRGVDDFIIVDDLIAKIWEILRSYDEELSPYQQLIIENEEEVLSFSRDKKFYYSRAVFYFLGHMFDEVFLFPIDRYFGGVEIVWTQKYNFAESLSTTISLLKQKLKVPKLDKNKVPPYEKEFAEIINKSIFDIQKTWFSPPTAFRLLRSTTRYFYQ